MGDFMKKNLLKNLLNQKRNASRNTLFIDVTDFGIIINYM